MVIVVMCFTNYVRSVGLSLVELCVFGIIVNS